MEKRLCLFVHGSSDIKNSTFGEKSSAKKRAIIEKSSVEKFFNSDFNATGYKSMIFEEFHSTFIVQLTILKRLLKGCSYAHPVTCCPGMKGTFSRVALSSVMYILIKLHKRLLAINLHWAIDIY